MFMVVSFPLDNFVVDAGPELDTYVLKKDRAAYPANVPLERSMENAEVL